jgi:hypothetical protein
MLKLKFEDSEVLALDYVDGGDGFLFLRLLGEEVLAQAVFAHLMNKDNRKRWGSGVTYRPAGQTYDHYVHAAEKVAYQKTATKLPNGLVDLVVFQSGLTTANDGPHGFFSVVTQPGIPSNFFRRLNSCCDVPMKEEWAGELWRYGLEEHQFKVWEQKAVGYGLSRKLEWKEQPKVVTPISEKENLAGGDVRLRRVGTGGNDRWAWYKVVLEILGKFTPEQALNERPRGKDVGDE